jgi:serine/threonine-protein kinase
MGDVYLARDERLQRRIAVKVLRADAERDPVARVRPCREALAAAALDHPFICKIFEIGEADGLVFVVMEFVDGDTLGASIVRPRARSICRLATSVSDHPRVRRGLASHSIGHTRRYVDEGARSKCRAGPR